MVTHPDLERHAGCYYGKYSGEVTNIEDENHQGTITVKVPAVFGPDLEVRARACFPVAHFFVPPVGAKVWVEFEAGDPNYPLWVGAWYPAGQAPQQAAITPPENRVIQTPSGHTIELMDKANEEKVVIRHSLNSFVSIDKDGTVIIANQKGSALVLNAKDDNLVLVEQHGNTVAMSDGNIVVTNKDGKAILELAGETVRVVAKDIILHSATVALGEQPAIPTQVEPAVLGATFANTYMLHTHPTAVGPSGPPIPTPGPPPPAPPLPWLSTAVMVKK